MTRSQEKLKRGFSPAVLVRCVCCGHKETVPLTSEMPACTQCLGPVRSVRMSTLTRQSNSIRTADTRIIPVKRANKVQTVQKLESGDLQVTLCSGQIFTISKDDELFQDFVVWTMLNSECTE